MKIRWKIILCISLLSLVTPVFLFHSAERARAAAEETYRQLRQEGFKVELGEFKFASSPELRAAAKALTTAGQTSRLFLRRDVFSLMNPVATNAAIPIATQETLATEFSEDIWPDLRAQFHQHQNVFDEACQAALGPRVEFEPVLSPSGDLLLPHLNDIRTVAFALTARTIMELHDGNRNKAWTNLLAVTQLITRWSTGPAEISQLVRIACMTHAQRALWEALHIGGWTDSQLALLQSEWEKPDFFADLPGSAAFARASQVMNCRRERQQPAAPGVPMHQIAWDAVDSPSKAWSEFTAGIRDANYRNYGTYEEERNILVYYRDRELLLRQVITSNSWRHMRAMPGVTNANSIQFFRDTRTQIGMRQPGFGTPQQGIVARAAEAEARRAILLTVLALERHRSHKNSYPDSLSELVPDLLATPATDFMDLQPLRYYRTKDGHFLLYSIGTDCIDQGGLMTHKELRAEGPGRGFWRRMEPDLVWPRPATAVEVEEVKRKAVATRNRLAQPALMPQANEPPRQRLSSDRLPVASTPEAVYKVNK